MLNNDATYVLGFIFVKLEPPMQWKNISGFDERRRYYYYFLSVGVNWAFSTFDSFSLAWAQWVCYEILCGPLEDFSLQRPITL